MDFSQLENLYIQFKKAERIYFRLRYQYWQGIAGLKKASTHTMKYKEFERRCRNLTKRVRRTMKDEKPRGAYQLDHKTSVLEAYTLGWSVEKTCERSNLEWLKRKVNQLKGIVNKTRFDESVFDS